MKHYDVYGIGNALVDSEYEVDDAFIGLTSYDKGLMTLIETDARHDLIHLLEEKHEHQVVKQAGGGSAANTIVIVAQLGASAFYSCKVADDPVGDFFMHDLTAAGVDTNLDNGREQGITGQCISMVTPDAERTMLTHLGITQTLGKPELDPGALANSSYLYIEGYLVSSPTALEAALEAQAIARAKGVSVTLTLSDPAMVENFKDQFDTFVERGVDILFCNEDEARLYTGANNRNEAVAALRERVPQFAMTCGKDGAVVCNHDEPQLIEGVPTTPVDTTGAGDIFAGAFLHDLCHGRSFAEAGALANRAASLLVSNFGARLTPDQVAANLKAG